jgi:hypothetical protein
MNKKKVFALRGKGNSGKTSTLKRVVEKFEGLHGALVKRLIDATDIRAIVSIGGLKIGIETEGDPNGRLEKSLTVFKTEGCVIIICATRTRGMTVKLVEALEPEYEIEWIEVSEKIDAEQEKIASKIFDKVLKEIKARAGHVT